MSRRAAILVGVLLALLTSAAHAEEPRRWSALLSMGVGVLGPSDYPTGGIQFSAGARYSHPLGSGFALETGPSVEVSSFVSGSKYMGFLLVPSVGAAWTVPRGWLCLGLAAESGWGRETIKAEWGYPVRYWGWYPGGTARVSIISERIAATLGVTLRAAEAEADTYLWSSVAAGGAFMW